MYRPKVCNPNPKVDNIAFHMMLKQMLKGSVPFISVENLLQNLENHQVLDAREKGEFEVSHIKNAHHIGYSNFDLGSLSSLNKTKPTTVYCSVGYRSEKIAEKLKEEVFSEVYNLFGGIFEWKNLGLSVYKNQEKTEQVHAFNKTWGVWLKKGEKVY